MSTPYELLVPTKWAQPPTRFSFSSLQAIAACPRRWQLVNSEWGAHRRFPERVHPSAIEGQIVHASLDLLSRALGGAGRPPLGSPAFQKAAVDCGFWEFFSTQVNEWNSSAARHPRTGPGFVIRTTPRELANRAIRLFREQYRAGGRHLPLSKGTSQVASGPLLSQLKNMGALSEVPLQHPAMPLAGIVDLVTLEDDATVTVVDYKTGSGKEIHRHQLLLYALLWWRVTGLSPSKVAVQYLSDAWEEAVSEVELAEVEKRAHLEIAEAMDALSQRPGPARTGEGCVRCPVRARCDDGWTRVESAPVLPGRTTDCEVTVVSQATPTGFTGHRRDGSVLAVVYDAAVGKGLPPVSAGSRLRVVDSIAGEVGKAVELRAWSECYVL